MEVRPVDSGWGFVEVRIGGLRVYSVCLPPNESRADLEDRLDRLTNSVRKTGPSPYVIMGDFNAASINWCSRYTNICGEIVDGWAATMDLVLLNVGATPTCIREQGTSIVDLSWCSQDMVHRVVNWRVVADEETLSDHCLIEITLRLLLDAESNGGKNRRNDFPKWALQHMK